MDSRKNMKIRARANLKRHYFIYLVLIIAVSALKIEFSSSLTFMHVKSDTKAVREILQSDNNLFNKDFVENPVHLPDDVTPQQTFDGSEQFLISAWSYLTKDFNEAAKSDFEIKLDHKVPVIEKVVTFSNDKGVIISTLNSYTSGIPVSKISAAIYSTLKYKSDKGIIFVILGNLGYLFCVFFIAYNARIILRRTVLEGRIYERIEGDSIFRQLLIHRWVSSCYALFLTFVYHLAWSFTIAGYFVKRYSYMMVPFIVAENPNIKANEAITLSRRMMDGYKWDCFKKDFTFMGWRILQVLTLGLTGFFYASAYYTTFMAEYYVEIRRLAIERGVEGVELLNDKYLYEYAPDDELKTAYADVLALEDEAHASVPKFGKLRQAVVNMFNIIVFENPISKKLNNKLRTNEVYESGVRAVEHESYPILLSPIEEKRTKLWQNNMISNRIYPSVNIVMMFFTACFVGWVWEVILHLIWDGKLVNRGLLHGPWLPVYGVGSLILFLVLNKLRKHPAAVFFCTIAICGTVEYLAAFMLDRVHDGEKWWDYSGYLVNLHGRICAEGLIVFGFAGIGFLYVLAPIFDNIFNKINRKLVIAVAIVLMILFAYDEYYSAKSPNGGKGVTISSTMEYEDNFCLGVYDEN